MKIAWIDFHKIGESVYTEDGDRVDITQEYADQMVKNFRYCLSRGYSVPLIRNHGRDDSYVYGDLLDMRIEGEWIQAGATFTRPQEQQAFDEGIMREFSPGFDQDWLDPHTGKRIGPTLLELSFCSLGYQRNLRAPEQPESQMAKQYLHTMSNNNLQFSTPTQEPKMAETTEVTVEERMTKLEAAVEEILAKLTEPDEEMMDEPDEEMAVEDEEKKEMSRRIQHLEDQLVKTQITNAGVKDDVEGLVKLARIDAKLFASTLKKLARTSQTEIGVMGVADTSISLTAIDAEYVAKAAKKSGADAPGKLTLFLSKNHPSFVERTQEVRAAIRKL
jgi:hypothetical protein